jgi:hypothetical protein
MFGGAQGLLANAKQQLLQLIGIQLIIAMFGPHASALTWRGFVDRLLLT